jgi:hypothetical protein
MTWLRRNRWWLLLVPLCLVLMLGASAYRVRTTWYYTHLHRVEGSARAGEAVTVTDDYDDAYGATSRTFTVRLEKLRTQDRLYGFDGPDSGDPPVPGQQAVAARLAWSARPDQSLTLCHVDLVDDQGRRYETPAGSYQSDLCVPEGHVGPEQARSKAEPRGYVVPGAERPEQWRTVVVFQVPEGIQVSKVLVWWSHPYYVELAVP